MAGIYIHIPFCKQACYYCDFHFSTNQGIKSKLTDAIAKELILQKEYLQNDEVRTIYFGGGTPSLLAGDEIEKFLETIFRNFTVQNHLEITLEANPDDLTGLKLKEFYSCGVNRLSIGIQSFHNHVLQFLNRAHDSASAKTCVYAARDAGFENISIDLIYAVPGQSEANWAGNIEQGLLLKPEHISAYSLTIEDKTVFGRWASKGKFKPVDEDSAASQLELLMQYLDEAGYEQYEISNFAKAGFHSQHNSSYWKQEKYLGVGPSAHSYNGATRQYNVSHNYEYLKSIEEESVPCTIEALTPENQINDYLLTTLRTVWGCNLSVLKEKYGYDLKVHHNQYLEQLLNGNFATLHNETITLTKKGRLLADKIASDFFANELTTG